MGFNFFVGINRLKSIDTAILLRLMFYKFYPGPAEKALH
ncbi:hypothetical protein BN873_90022 [Candidatus Competibacter denitrificans Run_A_D11]|uniref:Uncharacterized protein n=1 Tax=Candidatus Competibacter denitrificans Run_A_D11 TaxID=1400863 RepID=W6M8H3_9GAMM|nr:hypothetical protein BN873_90022 [Candidatus Competibacter denitrificans Run_A_D11]